MCAAPVVKLYHNPYQGILTDDEILADLEAVAKEADELLGQWLTDGEVPPEDNSFGWVMLDPTYRAGSLGLPIADQLFVAVELGPNGAHLALNGLGKADFMSRHGFGGGDAAVAKHPALLGPGDFDWDGGVCREYTYSAGSGFSEEQDCIFGVTIHRNFAVRIQTRLLVIREENEKASKRGWLGGKPHQSYIDALAQPYQTPASA